MRDASRPAQTAAVVVHGFSHGSLTKLLDSLQRAPLQGIDIGIYGHTIACSFLGNSCLCLVWHNHKGFRNIKMFIIIGLGGSQYQGYICGFLLGVFWVWV